MKNYIKINITSPQQILIWGERCLPNGKLIGKIKKPETIDYKTLKPINNGLFCEIIFGPIKNNECSCKLYKKIRLNSKEKTIICPNCQVQITTNKIRRYRMGFINLESIVTHPWYLQNTPSYISNIILNKNYNDLNKLNSFKYYINRKVKNNYTLKYSGAEAIKILLRKIKTINIKKLNQTILKIKRNQTNLKRLKVLNFFSETNTKLDWMIIKYLPVLPPDLRPILKMKDNNIITSDLNYIYNKIINSNNKLELFKLMKVDNKIYNKEKILLKNAIETLINSNKNNKYFKNIKSISKIIKGKHGRIRENLLGKTVDYSARAVITIEPSLKLNECGIPLKILTEIFQSFLIKKLLKYKMAKNIKIAKIKLKTLNKNHMKNILKDITKNYPILLNRAPTLHRISLQAFNIKLTKTESIKLHPLVCAAFNADFDGDQMGIHIPLTLKSQCESRIFMLSLENILSPSTGKLIANASQDIVLGCYYLTNEHINLQTLFKKIKYYKHVKNIIKDYKLNEINIHNYIWVEEKTSNQKNIIKIKIQQNKNSFFILRINRTTLGKIIFSKLINKLLLN
uniref:DNA-directed RNA polymerase subunit n=1 Tax=Phacus orbicularis TaxID=158829 RepID=A0A182B0W1_9EUGL|nr:RNA polymerase beta' subunit [Phacus orbicularis]